MTKDTIVTMFKEFPKLNSLTGAKFAYFVARNVSIMKPEIEALNAVLKGTPEFTDYEEVRIELAKSHAEKNPDGSPKTKINAQKQTEYVMKDPEDWKKVFAKFNEGYKEILDARTKQLEGYNELLKEESNIKFFKIKMKDIPVDISVEQMNTIIDLIENEE